jgi:hypothetical protein
MPQLYSLEERGCTRRITCCDNLGERIVGPLVPVAGQRAERLELSDGLHPDTNVTAMLPTPSLDRKGEVRSHELQQRGHAQRERELPGQEEQQRNEGRVRLRIIHLGEALQSSDDA